MSDDQSEQLDAAKLGEEIDAETLPGIDDYPPDEPLGVEDPTVGGEDDVATRERRERPEVWEEPARGDDEPVDLLPPDDDDDAYDGENQQIAQAEDPEGQTAPEVAAVHEVDDPRR